jgi:CspA family cold shock protein
MATGKVKWFNNAKGYGFVIAEVGGEDLFVHYSSIQMDGYKTLKAGQDVEFDIERGAKGMHAVNIRSLEADGEATKASPVEDDGIRSNDSAIESPQRGEYARSR